MLGSDYASYQGKTVYGSDGDKIGKVADLYAEDTGDRASFATVKTGLFGSKSTFIPLDQAEARADGIVVPYTKEFVKNAPNIEDDAEISEQEEQAIWSYYSRGATHGSTTTTDRDYATDTTREAQYAPATGADTDRVRGTEGYDTSGPTTDDAMTRSEERLRVGTQQAEAGRARLRKYVVTEQVTETVPVTREQVRVEREPITDANVGSATSGPAISEEEHEVVLHEERPVVQKEAVPVERVRLGTDTVTENVQVTEEVRKEVIDTDGVSGVTGRDRDRS
jgi:uncharacterized protein (TIGR02271 family)